MSNNIIDMKTRGSYIRKASECLADMAEVLKAYDCDHEVQDAVVVFILKDGSSMASLLKDTNVLAIVGALEVQKQNIILEFTE